MIESLVVSDEIYRCGCCGTWKNVLAFDIEFYDINEIDEGKMPCGETRVQFLRLCKKCIKMLSIVGSHPGPAEEFKFNVTTTIEHKISLEIGDTKYLGL